MARSATWRCRGCKTDTPRPKRKCAGCGKPKPRRRRPEHLKALDLPYEAYIELNGGEFCGICGRGPSEKRRLDRDHDHRLGIPRGLLCPRHNRLLANWVTPDILRAAADYLDRVSDTSNNP